MPRKLPWLVDDCDTKEIKKSDSKSNASKDLSRHETSQKTVGQNEGLDIAEDNNARIVDFLRSSRSPPTSPVREALEEEFMREGLDHDDKYIMVEDEFYAVAQSFTRHLHHAEYIRRRNLAKIENASVLKDIDRPTDGRTKMQPETIKRKESEKLRDKQNKALEAIGSGRPRVDSEDEESEVDKEAPDTALADDPWIGTCLHNFMTSPMKSRSLIGLQSIKSSTRAAAGYCQASDKRSRTFHHPSASETSRVQPVYNLGEETASEDDDLEASYDQAASLPGGHALKARTAIIRQSPKIPDGPFSKQSAASSSRSTLGKGSSALKSTRIDTRKRSLLDELDRYSFEGILEPSYSSPDQPSKKTPKQTSLINQSRSRDSKKSRLNDVPTFLV